MSPPTISRGSKSSAAAVSLMQSRLQAKGFRTAIDGVFGDETEDSLMQFQAANGLVADAICGPRTWALLMAGAPVETPKDVRAEARIALRALIPAGTHQPVFDVLDTAIDALGLREVPDGSNGGPEIAFIVEGAFAAPADGKPPSAYYLHWGVTDKATLQSMPPWCALFVCWAIRVGLMVSSWEATPFGAWFGGVAQIEAWAQKNSRWFPATGASIPAGALFTISRERSSSDAASSAAAGHIGFVVCDHGDGTVTTIEGNVSNAVGSHRRKKAEFRGYITWWNLPQVT